MIDRIAVRTNSSVNFLKTKKLLELIVVSFYVLTLFVPFASVYAEEVQTTKSELPNYSHENSTIDTSATKLSNYPAGQNATESELKSSTDATPLDGVVKNKLNNRKQTEESLKGTEKQSKISPRELTNKRNANTSAYLNADGSITEKKFFTPQYFKKDNAWSKIDTSLVEDKNAGDSENILGKVLGNVESWVQSTNNYIVKDNDWQARFSTSDNKKGMVRIQSGNSQVGFCPVDANNVDPKITTDKNGKQTVIYSNLWDGVDLEYIVETSAIKENIILKNKESVHSFGFKIVGAGLEKVAKTAESPEYFKISGGLGNTFAIAPANLILNNFGFVSEPNTYSQSYKNDVLSVNVNDKYFKALPEKAFPAVIDPTTFDSRFGTRSGGNYISFKSDGYVCPSTQCNLYAGTLTDSSLNLQNWRGAFFAPYDQFRNSNTILQNANLHLSQLTNVSFWTGNTNAHTYAAGHATCLTSINCMDANWGQATFGTAGDINVTSLYNAMINAGDFGAWLMISPNDPSNSSFKNFDPGNSYVTFTYSGIPPAPSVVSPVENQVFTDLQPYFETNTVANPNSSTVALKYEQLVSASPGASGSVITSGLIDTGIWTIPDGILQDGSTYYLQARSYDPTTGLYSAWGPSVPFKINLRNGTDKTQSYENVGPVKLNLATGNVSTTTSTHASSALGGSLGLDFSYNSPLRSRPGLSAKYWNVPANYSGGQPTSEPTMTRIDPSVNFNWGSGSPSSSITSDWFYGKWDGYFIPSTTGNYTFGGIYDDTFQVKVNGTTVHNASTPCSSAPCMGSSISLTAGTPVTISVDYLEATGNASAQLYVLPPGGSAQVVTNEMLQTGVRNTSAQHGLVGNYYGKFDGTNTFSSANTLLMKRTDPILSFDWGNGAPMPNGPSGFLVRWVGYVTVPQTGTYNFGSNSDDGTKITLGSGSNSTVVFNDWTPHGATEGYGSSYTLTANNPVPITVEYFDDSGVASFQLKVKGTVGGSAVLPQIVPSSWFTPTSLPLPDGWKLDYDQTGSLKYTSIRVNQTSVVLLGAGGDTHEYTLQSGGYKPPVNEDGQLTRNEDGTYTFDDIDGQTYLFSNDGTLSTSTIATDDRNPAALKYVYSTTNYGLPQLTEITDGVNNTRWARLYYSGNSNCGASPTGFDVAAPAGMLCAVGTNDGRKTFLYYTQGQLSRVMRPGNNMTDYLYQSVSNASGATIGFQLSALRDAASNDAIAAGQRVSDISTQFRIFYDSIGRVNGIATPTKSSTASSILTSFTYLPGAKSYVDSNGNTVQGYLGTTTSKTFFAPNPPAGFNRRVKYDNLFRTIEDTDNLNKSTTTVWDSYKDLVLSTTDGNNLKSTNIYDDEDRPITSYGPAPVSWFNGNTPASGYVNSVPRNDVSYDSGVNGLATAYYQFNLTNKNLAGTPKGHSTGIQANTTGDMNRVYYSGESPTSGITAGSNWAFKSSGKLRLPSTGSYTFRIYSDDGARMWLDDKLVIDDWNTGTARNHPTYTFNNVAGSVHRITLMYFQTGTSTKVFGWYPTGPNITDSNATGQYLKPDYSLFTSSKNYDSTIGNTTNTSSFGSTPENSLPKTSTQDSTGLNLTTSVSYETAGSGSYLRQTSKTQPGGNTTSYTYYGALETADNPCTPTVETYKQAGFLKTSTSPDPDGAGTAVGITSTKIYDDSGNVVASKMNNETSYTCTYYDTRGRVLEVDIPSHFNTPARQILNNWAVGGNPLVTSSSDASGTITTTKDILGHTLQYVDSKGKSTTYSYDTFDRLSTRVSPIGTETFVYDSASRIIDHKLGANVIAHVNYDATTAQISSIEYKNAGLLKGSYSYDSLGRSSSISYFDGSGVQVASDSVSYSQSGKVTSGTELGLNKTYTYDTAGRLTAASIGSNTFTYDFSSPNVYNCNMPSFNGLSNKNSNRTKTTVNGVSRYYCYNRADQLVYSDDPSIGNVSYDDYGNTTNMGTGSDSIQFDYDGSNRNTRIATSAATTQYSYDVQNRMVQRVVTSTINGNSTSNYGYISTNDSPDLLMDTSNNIVESYLHLIGGVTLTLRPNDSVPNNQKVYTVQNIHGDAMGLFNASGSLTATYMVGPFGEKLPSAAPANGQTIAGQGAIPNNTSGGAAFQFAAKVSKLTETNFTLSPIQMGARVYIPSIGRFLQRDPIEGGMANAYVYALDPVNTSDYSGTILSSLKKLYNAMDSYFLYLTNRQTGVGGKIIKLSDLSFNLKQVGKSLATQTVQNKGTGTFYGGDTKSACYAPMQVAVAPSNGLDRAMTGTATLFVIGTLSVKDNTYSLKGRIVGGYDYYDFDSNSSGKRSLMGEFSTRAGAFGGFFTNARNYNAYIIGEQDIDVSGTF